MRPRVLLIKAAPTADRPSVAPPLGVLTLASWLRQELDAEVRVHDAGFEMYGASPPPVATVQKLVADLRPHVVGLGALTCERDCLGALARAVKEIAPDTTVVVGGPYPTSEPESWRACPAIDLAIRGEADEALPELVARIVRGQDPRGIPGVVDRISTPVSAVAPPIADLDSVPLPAWDLIDLRAYARGRYRNQTGLPARRVYASVTTSRGCPYRCAYCHDVLGKRFRGYSVERVMAEIDDVVARGAREIHFVDDIFNFDLGRAKEIFGRIAERHPGLSIAFPNGLRADRLDEEFAIAARRAGTWYAGVAIETASPRLQKLIHKHLNLEKVRRAIQWLERAGICTRSFVMLGFPTETEAEMEATIRFVIDSDTSEASFFNVVPYPGSGLYELAEQESPGTADDVVERPFYSEASYYARVTGRDLSRIRDRAIRRFYLSRLRFARSLWRMPLRAFFSRAYLETLWYFGARAARSVLPRRARRSPEATVS